MQNPAIGEKFLIVGRITNVYGDESMDVSQRHATIVLDDGQTIETNLRNLLDPQIVVQTAGIEHTVDATALKAAPVVQDPQNVSPPAPAAAQPETVQVHATDAAGSAEKA